MTVKVAGGAAVAALGPGSRVDVLVSSESGAGGGRTTMALAAAEVLAVGESSPAAVAGDAEIGGSAGGPTVQATLRVSLRQAIYLTAADNFAREIRLLPRPPGDHAPAGGTVSEPQL